MTRRHSSSSSSARPFSSPSSVSVVLPAARGSTRSSSPAGPPTTSSTTARSSSSSSTTSPQVPLRKATAEIKLAPGDSAGTVTAFYMSSDGPNHHEFDFEFLGNSSGEPILVQTNVYGGLWFDPTADFHSYGILWNRQQVEEEDEELGEGARLPRRPADGIYSSIWNADDWATQGGRVKIDWSHAPFVTTYRGFWSTPAKDMKRCAGQGNEQGRRYWWQEPMMEELSLHQSHQLLWSATTTSSTTTAPTPPASPPPLPSASHD
ncbi:unnamed protein product [Spirodela intermedia]|uniref:GH16 domain-containing protein n=1 Tax=Spirodela intermedia TaxID=51605 RepID=A0A7I8IKT6_SPIIN|nr:unnamed protein product [Spirodela intermedia]CAA6658353.1 unnamed protein product [Spirodela intermedia]